MVSYILCSIKKNKSRLYITMIILVIVFISLNFSMQVVDSLTTEMNKFADNPQRYDELESMQAIIVFFMMILGYFAYKILNTTWGVILVRREKEFRTLFKIGMSNSKIKRIVFGEAFLVVAIAFVIGSILGVLSGSIFCYCNHFSNNQINFLNVIYIWAGIILVMWLIVHRSFSCLKISRKCKNMRDNFTYSLLLKKGLLAILGGMLFINADRITSFFKVYAMNSKDVLTIKEFIICISLALLLEYVYAMFMAFLKMSSKIIQNNGIYIAIMQNLYHYKKNNKIIVSTTFAVVLIVAFVGMCKSVEYAVEDETNKNISYNYKVQFDYSKNYDYRSMNEKIGDFSKDNKIVKSLVLELEDKEGNRVHLLGVDQDFYVVNKIEQVKSLDSDENDMEKIVALFPAKKAADNKWEIGDVISGFYYQDKEVKMQIVNTYKQVSIPEVYVSRKFLSEKIYSTSEIFNVLYISFDEMEQVYSLMKSLNINEYDVMDRDEIVQHYVDESVKSNEVIEMFLYINLLITMIGIINIFMLSFTERVREYSLLKIIGMRRNELLNSMKFEFSINYLIAILKGGVIGYSMLRILLISMIGEDMITIRAQIPILKLTIIFVIAWMAMIGVLEVVGRYCLNRESEELGYRE